MKRRKNPTCLNCNQVIGAEANYCPNCGQENNDRRVAFSDLVLDVLSSLFSYDSQFARSIIPFLFRPGFLTKEFLAGRRKRYIQPLRLYFAMSFLFFLIVPTLDSASDNEKTDKSESKKKPRNIISFVGDSSDAPLIVFGKSDIEEDSLAIIDSLENAKEEKLSRPELVKQKADSVRTALLGKKDSNSQHIFKNFEKFFSPKTQRLVRAKKLSPEKLIDTLGLEKTGFNQLLARQVVKLASDEGDKSFASYVVGKIPLMMFILMPLVALLLKFIYFGLFSKTWRYTKYYSAVGLYQVKKPIFKNTEKPQLPSNTRPRRYYVEHLIFTLNIHSFIYFAFVTEELISKVYASPGIGALIVILTLVYLFISFLKVYRENWFKTLLKMFVLSIGYVFCFALCLLGTIFLGLLLF
ncbi:MAG: DUF3667 domain-containing protein [Verrucomicrobia bacterium]|nr:DUF3667 domain-containing protein [Cytophagales bacterium]